MQSETHLDPPVWGFFGVHWSVSVQKSKTKQNKIPHYYIVLVHSTLEGQLMLHFFPFKSMTKFDQNMWFYSFYNLTFLLL